jgi:hypothetical protein
MTFYCLSALEALLQACLYVPEDVYQDTLRSAKIYISDWEKLCMDLRPALAAALHDR